MLTGFLPNIDHVSFRPAAAARRGDVNAFSRSRDAFR
jgi:hypothetical protein